VKYFHSDHTVFIRCRSFQESAKNGGAGYAVAYSVDKFMSWRLGVLAYNHPDLLDQSKVLIYEWKGQLHKHGTIDRPPIPDYSFAKKDSWKDYFELKCIDVVEEKQAHRNIFFLNQVSGPRVGGVAISEGLVNLEDNCYQSSRVGPCRLLPGFSIFVSAGIRNKTLGFGSLQRDDGPKVTPLKSASPKVKRKRVKEEDSIPIVTRRVNPEKSFDEVEQPVYIVQDGEDRLKGRTITTDPWTGATSLSTETNLLAIPYVECSSVPSCGQPMYVFFGLMSLSTYTAMVTGKERATRKEHNAYLDTHSISKLSCLLIDASTHSNGFRVCVSNTYKELLDDLINEGDGARYEIMSSRPPFSAPTTINGASKRLVSRDASVICLTNFAGGNEKLPGGAVCVSRVFPLPLSQAVRTTLPMANLLYRTYGVGFGSRPRSASVGQNLYLGYRDSSRPRRTLIEGPPGDLKDSKYPYSRQNFLDVGMPLAESHARGLSFIEQYSLWLDPVVHNVLKAQLRDGRLREQGVCRVAIITQGISGLCFSFANTPHVDRNDQCCHDATAIKKLVEAGREHGKRMGQSEDGVSSLGAKYIERWMNFSGGVGLSNPTTCGYNFIGHFVEDDHGAEVYLYFILDGLGVAYRLISELGHLMYASLFSHQTSVCLAVSGDYVYYHGEGGRVFAWGKSGKK
jgi:hypothetical protein